MQLTKKKYILTFSLLFLSVYAIISIVFSEFIALISAFASKSKGINKILSNGRVICGLMSDKTSEKSISLSIKELNTATVYINGSNHNLVYAASACRLHPGPTLYRQKAFRITQGD
jgi:hypothetical protein